ncbi:uncharacterized protein EI97DRAFT_305142 [Westerdykella ornata]|uniref:Uncharacterized protein n=1 Tax=Westerdykella ornata TaxID=318751 RepID=A0A6A6JLJ5_WESOR|nr:uncharacterized protein EI97DRAFT_305142 [Westerdykella ornata]KAF2276983.1 hypothetical protein EI97DRAFT_305142 [Westerdykella ornata]
MAKKLPASTGRDRTQLRATTTGTPSHRRISAARPELVVFAVAMPRWEAPDATTPFSPASWRSPDLPFIVEDTRGTREDPKRQPRFLPSSQPGHS